MSAGGCIVAGLMSAALVLLATPASATTYVVDYDWNSANHFKAVLEGTLNATTKRITITSVTSLARNDVAIAGALSILSTDKSYGFSSAAPTFAADGSYVDFVIYQDTPSSTEQLMFQVGNRWSRFVGTSVGLTSGWGGNDNVRAFAKSSFSVEVATAAVPEPSSWATMVGGFGLVGAFMRRRNAKVSFA